MLADEVGLGKTIEAGMVFSALRLSGGSNAGDFESLSQPILPAAAFDEIATRGYGILNLEYRFEALFFLFLHARGTLARADRA